MEIFETITTYFTVFDFGRYPLAIVDILVVALLFYGIYRLIRDTKAIRIAIGIIIVSAIFLIGQALGLIALTWLLKYFVTFIVVAIPVVFQPELRRAFERLGRARSVRKWNLLTRRESSRVTDIISDAVEVLKKNKIGALIVIRRTTGLADHVAKGTILNAELSRELLLNIFFPRSPLHDGAMIVTGNQIAAAGVVLPLTESETAFQLGTRHKAAIGITEETDAVAVVISEERAEVSLVIAGKVKTQTNMHDFHENLLQALS
ncbi:diadenylate cyclase CdaA [Patescibacteria group bacterium]